MKFTKNRAQQFGLRGLLAFVLVLTLAACRSNPERPALRGDGEQQMIERIGFWQMRPQWTFAGRAAVSLGKDGGNLSLLWRQVDDQLDISLSMPITGRTVRLQGRAGDFRLTGLDQGELWGTNARDLLQRASGWDIPFESIAYWVRGMPAPGERQLRFDEYGLPQWLLQDGWQIEFKAWDDAQLRQPAKLFIESADASVRLSIRQWEIQ